MPDRIATTAFAWLGALLLLATGCSTSEPGSAEIGTTATTRPSSTTTTTETPTSPSSTSSTTTTSEPARNALRFGAEVLADDGFASLRGKRVGAIVNQTSLVDGRRLIDLLAEVPEIDLTALFAPEHGIDGSLAAGVSLPDSVDAATQTPIHSLYGATRQPTVEMFADLDVVVFDLQDVGSRSYTYISTMGLAMQTAAATGTTFMVLDRPNPVGGTLIAGPILEADQESFIGMYPLPSMHAMTVGEIAIMITEERWLPGLDDLDLVVVAAEGWSRSDQWSDLDRPWIPPSPRLPSSDIAQLYNGMVLLAGTSLSDGSGTETPFALVGDPFLESGSELADILAVADLAGVRFSATTFTPQAIEGVSPNPRHEGITLEGIEITITDHESIEPVAIAIEVLVAAQELAGPDRSVITDPASFDLVAGTPDLRRWIEQGDRAETIMERFEPGLAAFAERRTAFLLYD